MLTTFLSISIHFFDHFFRTLTSLLFSSSNYLQVSHKEFHYNKPSSPPSNHIPYLRLQNEDNNIAFANFLLRSSLMIFPKSAFFLSPSLSLSHSYTVTYITRGRNPSTNPSIKLNEEGKTSDGETFILVQVKNYSFIKSLF